MNRIRTILLAVALGAASGAAQSPQPKPVVKRAVAPVPQKKQTVTLLIRSDASCRMRLNGEDYGERPAGEVVRFEAPPGQNIVDVRSLDGQDRWVQIVEAEEPGGQQVVLADLAQVVQARLDQEAVLAAEQARVVEQAKQRASTPGIPASSGAPAYSQPYRAVSSRQDDIVQRQRAQDVADQRMQRDEERRQRAAEQEQRRQEAEEADRQRVEQRREQLLLAAERAEEAAQRCEQELARWESYDDPNDAARGLKTMNENCIRAQREAAERLRRQASAVR